MNNRLVGGLACSSVGLLLYIVGIATTAWLSNAAAESGLWQTCTKGRVRICASYDIGSLNGAYHACRFFAVVGALLMAVGILAGVVHAVKHSLFTRVNKKRTAGGLIIVAGVCGLITAATFTGYYENEFGGAPYGYSFYLTWIQGLFTIGGGVACFIA
ncbi:lens fiber membrane intrinsic protein-like [Branchiostoma lanceolatum]|uniref:lens fiber membrane intrinsic protein-like n=1 Tax=Branchiostoma lanceolatum TaxID=7740 RepID=UPI0034513E9B